MTLEQQFNTGIRNTEFSEFAGNPDFGTYYSMNTLSVPVNGNIIIEDMISSPDMTEGYRQLASENQRELVVFGARELTARLAAQLDQLPKSATLLFPGNGSRIIQKILQESYPEILNDRVSLAVKTNRRFENGIWSVSAEVPDLSAEMQQCSEWVVVDDVVVSGQTAEAIRFGVVERTGRSSDSWVLAAWLALDPKRRKKMNKTKSPSSVEGFNDVSSIVTYKGSNGIPPCNSLSTLLQPDEKGNAVRQKLKSSYFKEGFDQFLQQLSYGTT